MFKYLLFNLLFIFNFLFAQQQVQFTVTIISTLHDSSRIYLSGNLEEFGKWRADGAELKHVGHGKWSRTFLIPLGKEAEFKFTKGSWNSEAVNAKGEIPVNYSLKIVKDTSLIFRLDHWKDEFKKNNIQRIRGKVTGNVRYHHNLKGMGIRSRGLIVWLPDGYDTDKKNHYPVLYMQDGQNIFDPLTSAFGIDWQIDETADSLIMNKKIEPVIIVGIENTPDRGKEYNDTELGCSYMRFVVHTVKPFIDSTYRTLPSRENTAVGGSSLGGLISFMLVWEFPEVFSKAICISPAFKIENINYVSKVVNYSGSKKNIKIYIDDGGEGVDFKLRPGIEDMTNALIDKGFTLDVNLFVYYYPAAQHSEKYWAARFWKPLMLFYGSH